MTAPLPPHIADFLAAHGAAGRPVHPLAGDASKRRYLRVGGDDVGGNGGGHGGGHGGGNGRESLVLMDAPRPDNESMAVFVAVTDWLRARGLSAPRVLAADLDRGLLLLEDLGDHLFARVLASAGADEPALYAAAVDLLPAVALDGAAAAPAGCGCYDAAALLAEARLATDWYARGAGAPLTPDALAEYDALVDAAMAPYAGAAQVLVLRDYHAENLLWLPSRAGEARVGLLDYQDALVGHPAYDLVSLLEDARRDVPPALAEAMLARATARLAVGERAGFRAAYAAFGAQRNLKIVGIFARLALRDGKPRYLALIPRVWGHLQGDLAAPGLAPLAAFVARWLPAPTPPVLAAIAARAAQPA
ncbi:MAG: phosphotransferase [Pseudomonadota bacterium]